MNVLVASSEIAPYAKTGGLGDVMSSLPRARARLGVDVSLVMPAYASVVNGGYSFDVQDLHVSVPISKGHETTELLKSRTADGIPIYFVRSDRYYDREYLYGTPDGDYPDNARRFTFFSRAILELANLLKPSIIHANDWQSSMALAFLRAQPERYPQLASTRTVLTVHNLGYQGRFRAAEWPILNLDSKLFTPGHLEFYGDINFLKGGIVFADGITTVSPTYAEEIKSAEQGFGLEGVFQERSSRLFGILNGVDYRVWNPATDAMIAANYDATNTNGKSECAADLRSYFRLDKAAKAPIVGMVTRLSAQKGLDLVLDSFDDILRRDCDFALLGSGDRRLQDAFKQLIVRHKGRVGIEIGFSESVAHKITAGSDILLMPSRYEPGGLTQLYGLKYGTIPVVRATGGLKDTVVPFDVRTGVGNGFAFSSFDSGSLISALDRALEAHRNQRDWARLLRNAMLSDFSWERSAREYLEVYKRISESPPNTKLEH